MITISIMNLGRVGLCMYKSPMSSFSEANAFIPESFVFYLNTSSGPLAFPPSAPRLKIFNDSKYTSVNSVSQ